MSRKLEDLVPEVRVKAEKLLALCKSNGIDVLVTDTLRTFAEQNTLYAQGRTSAGPEVTKAKAGHSWHNFGRAFDVVPLQNGRPNWRAPDFVWRKIGTLGESVGLEWGGRWTVENEGLVDKPHFEDRGGLTLAEARERFMPKDFENA